MADFMLVHGAWCGGWCWRDLAPLLAAAGHRVATPTLAGMAERAGELSADIGVARHGADVLAAIDAAGFTDVVLVGHSYGARPAALAAGHPAVRRWISLDGAAVGEGTTLMDGAPPAVMEASVASLVADGLGLPPLPAKVIGMPADHPAHDWVESQLTPTPWRTLTEPMPPTALATRPRDYLRALGNRLAAPRAGLAEAERAGWPIHPLDSGHLLPITAPRETADWLLRLAA